MSFLNAAREQTATSRAGGICRVALLYDAVDPELANEIMEAMADRAITLVAIERELLARNITVAGRAVSRHSLERHRRRILGKGSGCLCEVP